MLRANQPTGPKFPNSAPSDLNPENPQIPKQKNKTPEKSGVRQQSEAPGYPGAFLLPIFVT
jgi:hypothetical protein